MSGEQKCVSPFAIAFYETAFPGSDPVEALAGIESDLNSAGTGFNDGTFVVGRNDENLVLGVEAKDAETIRSYLFRLAGIPEYQYAIADNRDGKAYGDNARALILREAMQLG